MRGSLYTNQRERGFSHTLCELADMQRRPDGQTVSPAQWEYCQPKLPIVLEPQAGAADKDLAFLLLWQD